MSGRGTAKGSTGEDDIDGLSCSSTTDNSADKNMMPNNDENIETQEDSHSKINRATVIFALCAAVNSVNVSEGFGASCSLHHPF